MRSHVKLMLTAVVATLALTIGCAVVSANRSIEFTGARGISRVRAYTGRFTFSEPAEEFRIVCEVSVELSFDLAIVKWPGASAGWVREAVVRGCMGGTARFLTGSMPWHNHYSRFTGTLPYIATVGLVSEVQFLIEAFLGLARCLYRGAWQMTFSGTGTQMKRIVTDPLSTISLALRLPSSAICPREANMRGALGLDPWVTVRLL